MQGVMLHLIRSLIRLVPLALIIIFIIGTVGPGPALADPGWYDTDWQYRKKITINSGNVTGNLSNFPVLISIVSDSDIGSHAQLNGNDILFTQVDEVSKIPHEIESFSSNGATANLTAWVKVPSLSSTTDTVIYIYYGYGAAGNQEDPSNVWDSNYKMVQHLHETSGTHYDSTQFNNDGTSNITPASNQNATGMINGADYFDGSDDYVDCGNDPNLQITANLTVEAWAKRDVLDAYQTLVSKNSFNAKRAWFIRLENNTGGNKVRFYASKDGTTSQLLDSDTAINDTGWHYFVITYQYVSDGASQVRMYIDGSLDKSDNTFIGDIYGESPVDVLIGALYSSGDAINNVHQGTIDEVRISDNARTADWIKTSYNNQDNPSAFFTLDSEQNAPAGPTAVGGKILTVNKAMVLAPWILIAIALCIVIIRLIQHFRKKVSSHSPHEDNP